MAEAIIIYMEGPYLFNSKGEWNVCSISGLVLEYKEPDEESHQSKLAENPKLPGQNLLLLIQVGKVAKVRN